MLTTLPPPAIGAQAPPRRSTPPPPYPPPAVQRLLEVTGDYYGVTPAELLGRRKLLRTAFARMVVMYLARHRLRCTFTDIGDFLRRDHSTCCYGVQKITQLIADDERTRLQVAEIERKLSLPTPPTADVMIHA